MIYIPLLLFCVAFFELFVFLRIGEDALAIIARSQEAMRVLVSKELGDDEKEVFMRRASGQIFLATLRFAAKFLLIGLVLYVLFLGVVTAFADLEAPLLESFVSPVVIIVLTAATLAYAWVRKTVRARFDRARTRDSTH